jgi:hypothetical protein
VSVDDVVVGIEWSSVVGIDGDDRVNIVNNKVVLREAWECHKVGVV